MAGPAFSDDSPPIAFAARRRRLLLAAGAITLTAGLAPRLQLGGLYWGSKGHDIVTSATDPKVPGIQQYIQALQTG